MARILLDIRKWALSQGSASLDGSRLRPSRLVRASVTVGLLTFLGFVWAHQHATAKFAVNRVANDRELSAPTALPKSHLAAAYGKLPLSFEVNAGQADAAVRFLARGRGYSLFLTETQAVLALKANPVTRSAQDQGSNLSAALRMSLLGANPVAQVNGLEELPGKSNYFLG